MTVDVRIQQADFSVADEWAALRARLGGAVGAVASFVGLVRDGDDSSPVTGLHLEHYPGMTERSIREIVADAEARWPLNDVLVIHRVGDLRPGDQIVFVQVASRHRAAAFDACELIMDYLKTRAVFWKREQLTAGQRWVEATGDDRQRVSRWGPSSCTDSAE